MQLQLQAWRKIRLLKLPFSLRKLPFKRILLGWARLKGAPIQLKGHQPNSASMLSAPQAGTMTLQTRQTTLQLEGQHGWYAPALDSANLQLQHIL